MNSYNLSNGTNIYYIFEDNNYKIIGSDVYNCINCKKTGQSIRWGKNENDDPQYCAIGPEIADIEITSICHQGCPWCYKSNTSQGKYMTLKTFKKIFENIPKHVLTQIAFGVDANCATNPEWFDIFKYTREQGIVPNVTVANIDDATAYKLASICGAVAVSRYANKNICYDSVQRLTNLGMKQVNIHVLVSEETYPMVMETIKDTKTDPRLRDLNAIVFLSLKKKGRGINMNILDHNKYINIIEESFVKGIKIGFDSCGCHKFLDAIKDNKYYKYLVVFAEPCESSLFSMYCNVEGKFFPCSFMEGQGEWKEGLDLINCKDFLKDIWNNPKTIKFRESLLNNNRKCPIFKI